MDNKVVITGIGSITPAGVGNMALLDVLGNGTSCAAKLDFDNPDIVNCVGAPVPNFNVNDFMPFKYSKRLDRGEQLFAAACLMALEDSGLDSKNPERLGVYQGTALGGMPHALAVQNAYRKNGFSSVSPLTVLGEMTGAGSALVALLMGLKGPNISFSTASLSSAVAFHAAVDALRLGRLDAIIVGGGEAPLVWQLYLMFERANMLAAGWNDRPEQACRPFDKDRNGLVLAEAGAALVLERLEVATKRNARIYAEVGGMALTNDAYNLVAPEPEPFQKSNAMVQALQEARVDTALLSHIIAHGTSTQLNDPVETKAMKLALAEMACHIPINSIKSMLGHPFRSLYVSRISECDFGHAAQFSSTYHQL